MPQSKNLPSAMCTGCANYIFYKGQSKPHHCKDGGTFAYHGKCGQDPDKEGTSGSCRRYEPKK